MSPYAALPAAAFDRDAAPQALGALVALLAERTRLVGMVWPLVERDGPFARRCATGWRCRARSSGATLARGAAARRARPPSTRASTRKRRNKWARQARKLAARGKLEEIAGDAGDRRRSSRSSAAAGKARAAPRSPTIPRASPSPAPRSPPSPRDGRLDALTLRLDGAPIAAGLVLDRRRPRVLLEDRLRRGARGDVSPGVQLTLAHSRRLAATPGLTLADSCARQDHPMIGRVWGDALAFEDWALGLRAGSERPLRIWAAAAQAKAWAREAAKRGFNAMRGRKNS